MDRADSNVTGAYKSLGAFLDGFVLASDCRLDVKSSLSRRFDEWPCFVAMSGSVFGRE